MNLNVLLPGKAVQSAFDEPNTLSGLILVLLSGAVSILFALVFGFAGANIRAEGAFYC